MFRCIVNEGGKGECLYAADTREELEAMLSRQRREIRTKRFFKIKPTDETSELTLDGSRGLVPTD